MLIIPDLPQEILIDIFSRLPPKSAGKCRCLSKQWRTQLSTPHFAKAHLLKTRKTHQQSSHILTAPSGSLHSLSFEPSRNWSEAVRFGDDLVLLVNHAGQIAGSIVKNDAVSRKLRLPRNWEYVVGSCDGLVLLVKHEEEKFLLNPITQEMVKLPDSPLPLKEEELSFCVYGFGYDCSTDDYKVVTLSVYDTDFKLTKPFYVETIADVCSVKSGVWRRIGSSPFDHDVPELASGAFINGAVHWLAKKRGSGYRLVFVIAAFNLADEVFHEIPTPKEIDLEVSVFVSKKLVVLRGCLCMVDAQTNSFTDVWVMEKYGVVESWTRLVEYDDYGLGSIKPLCFIGDDDEEIVFVNERKRLAIYNLKEGNVRGMLVDGVKTKFLDGVTFEDSLISPFIQGAERGCCLN